MARKIPRASSGAPGIKNGMGGPALNPLGLSKNNYLDPTVAAADFESEWDKFWQNDSKVAAFSRPVKPRTTNKEAR